VKKIFLVYKIYIYVFIILLLGGLAIAVPGALKGYSTIYNLYGGGVPWSALFEPTIRLCEEGIRISEFLEAGLIKNEKLIKKDPLLKYK